MFIACSHRFIGKCYDFVLPVIGMIVSSMKHARGRDESPVRVNDMHDFENISLTKTIPLQKSVHGTHDGFRCVFRRNPISVTDIAA